MRQWRGPIVLVPCVLVGVLGQHEGVGHDEAYTCWEDMWEYGWGDGHASIGRRVSHP